MTPSFMAQINWENYVILFSWLIMQNIFPIKDQIYSKTVLLMAIHVYPCSQLEAPITHYSYGLQTQTDSPNQSIQN